MKVSGPDKADGLPFGQIGEVVLPRSAPHVQMRGKDRAGRVVVVGAQDHAEGSIFEVPSLRATGPEVKRGSGGRGTLWGPFHPTGAGDSEPAT